MKTTTIPEDMLELLSHNFRPRKLTKYYLAHLLIFEITGPEDEVTQRHESQSSGQGSQSGLWLVFCH